MKPEELIKLLEKEVFVKQSGSHAVYVGFKIIVVPIHSKGVPVGTLKSILKDASFN